MSHPFLNTAFHIKWSTLTPEHVESDIALALEKAQCSVTALTQLSTEKLTFDNVLIGLERATQELSEAWGKVGHLDSVCNNTDLRKAYNAMLPKVSAFFTQISLNPELWKVIKLYSETNDAKSLQGTRKRLLEETLEDFRQSGADLPEEKKKRLAEVNASLAQLTQKFSENVLDSTNAWELVVDDLSQLEGLPESALAAAQQSALKKGYGTKDSPRWRFTLHAPSLLPALTYLESAELREKIWRASVQIGAKEGFDNTSLIWEILALRHEKAQLLGYAHFADYTTKRRMAKTGATALKFTEDLHKKVQAAFHKDVEQLCAFRQTQSWEQADSLEPWDIAYWCEVQRKAHYNFDEEALRPYFPINRVIDGLFTLATQVFGVVIVEKTGVDTWHPEVKYYEMHDKGGRHMGSFYADWHPRETKRGGAWMNHFKTGICSKDGTSEPHLGLICGNLTPAIGDKPALLTHREVETIFHEFGHLIHHLSGSVDVRTLNGIHVVWDFVELPSQIMENWCWERESLDLFARHYKTGEPIPQELFDKMVAAKNYQSAMVVMRQLSLGKLDLELHINYPQWKGRELEPLLQELLAGYTIPYRTRPPSIVRRFTHLFADSTGYAAGYYSYKWAEVLDADAFTRFKKEGILNAKVGSEFRTTILSKGNSESADKLFRDFMGRDPDPQALLKRCGIG